MSKKSRSGLTSRKHLRRRWLTSLRMVRYGVNNFSRNIWLTAAATAVMSVTLLFIFVTFATRNVLNDTLSQVRDQVGYSIYLKPETPDTTVATLQEKLETLKSVKRVTAITSKDAMQQVIDQNKQNVALLSILPELPNQLPATLRVVAKDSENTKEIQDFIRNDADFQLAIEPTRPATFNNATLKTIAMWGNFAQQAGIFISILFIIISVLIVFNTIRMAIFNRKEEIQMMKIIGADRSFIRGPFIVESMVYGFIAAIIGTSLGYAVLYFAEKPLSSWINIAPTLSLGIHNIPYVTLGMIIIGSLVGVLSSMMAVRRYLRL